MTVEDRYESLDKEKNDNLTVERKVSHDEAQNENNETL